MSIYDPAEEQREIALLKAKLSEKGRAFNEALLMQGAEIAALRAEVERLRRERDAALVHGPEDMVRALEEVRAEVERLRALIDEADRGGWTVKGLKGAIAASRAKVANLEAEVARLRERADAKRQQWRSRMGLKTTDAIVKENAEAWAEVARLRAFAKRLLIVHEMRDEKTAEAIIESALRGEEEK